MRRTNRQRQDDGAAIDWLLNVRKVGLVDANRQEDARLARLLGAQLAADMKLTARIRSEGSLGGKRLA